MGGDWQRILSETDVVGKNGGHRTQYTRLMLLTIYTHIRLARICIESRISWWTFGSLLLLESLCEHFTYITPQELLMSTGDADEQDLLYILQAR